MIGALKQLEAQRLRTWREKRGIEAHDLRLEGELRWVGCEPGAGRGRSKLSLSLEDLILSYSVGESIFTVICYPQSGWAI
jgi:hypothetical protein